MNNKLDNLIMLWGGKVIGALGVGGLLLTVSFDKLAGRVGFDPGWLQTSGIVVFICLIGFGYLVDQFLATVREMLK